MFDLDVVGLGALNIDHVYTVGQVVSDGVQPVTGYRADAGGCAANTAYALARLGLRCGFLGAVGDDATASIILRSFQAAGVDTDRIVVKAGSPTAQALIATDGEGRRAIYVDAGASALFSAQDVDPAYIARARLVHASSFNGHLPFDVQRAVLAALRPEAKLALTLDGLLAPHGLAAVRELVARCHLVFGNVQEIERLTRCPAAQGVRLLLDTGCGMVVVTFGGGARPPWLKGDGDIAACLVSADGQWTVPALPTYERPIVDTTGAGDAFAAGFLWGLLAGSPPQRCASLGHVLAGFCLTAVGCRAGLPTLDRLLARHRRAFGQ